jgi:hypothetical protein
MVMSSRLLVRHRWVPLVIAVLAGSVPVYADDLLANLRMGNQQPDKPMAQSVYENPEEVRQGGDTIEDAIPITIPGTFVGTTVGYNNNYDEICPWRGSTAPEVVYVTTPDLDLMVDMDLCYSTFDTKLYVYDENLNLLACNDDFNFAPPCYSYTSKLTEFLMIAGLTYYIVVDGWGPYAGDYQLDIYPVLPCYLTFPAGAQYEDEPPLVDGYLDAHNGGCSSPDFGFPMQPILGPVFGGNSGWYISATGGEARDTDWFTIEIPASGILEITGLAEHRTLLAEIWPQDCSNLGANQILVLSPCIEATMTIMGEPGAQIWLWVSPTTFSGPVNEYRYILNLNIEEPPTRLTVDPQDWGPENCAETVPLTYRYEPNFSSQPLRGYNVRLVASPPLLITPVDVQFQEFPENVHVFSDVLENAANDLTISFAILGGTGQIDTASDLFTIQVNADTSGTGEVAIASHMFRDLFNAPIAVEAAAAATIEYACDLLESVTGLTALPGHNQVELSWAYAGGDSDRFAVFRSRWYDEDTGDSSYPHYGQLATNVIPERPLSYAEAVGSEQWELITAEQPVAEPAFIDTWVDGADRGLYLYEVFAVDDAQNASPPALAGAGATNYWLGDVVPFVYDGLVDIQDMHRLGEVFGLCTLDTGFDPECDVGPTADQTSFGLPEPDGCIDFQDLMVFAANFGVVEPGEVRRKNLVLQRAQPSPVRSASVDLAWVRLAPDRYALRLAGGEALRGLRLRAALPVGVEATVGAGDLLDGSPGPVFLHNVGPDLDVNVAIMGPGQGLAGTGDLFEVQFSGDCSTPVVLLAQDLAVDARGLDGDRLTVRFHRVAGSLIPQAFSLDANYPNPFNPLTTIRFALPAPLTVHLAVFGLDGRKVATLAGADYEAGVHEVIWNGRDDRGRAVAAGTYVYRIDAGPHRQVKKMVLVR